MGDLEASPRLTDEEFVRKGDDEASVCACNPIEKKYAGRGLLEDPYVVEWDQNDPENPYNWSKRRKWVITLQVRTDTCRMRIPQRELLV